MLETTYYYSFKKSSVCVLMLDVSKAFDKVNYCELLIRSVSPVIPRLRFH